MQEGRSLLNIIYMPNGMLSGWLGNSGLDECGCTDVHGPMLG